MAAGYIRFSLCRSDEHPCGYDTEAVRQLVYHSLAPNKRPRRLVLDVEHWRGEPHEFVVYDLAQYVPDPGQRVDVSATDPDTADAWERALTAQRQRNWRAAHERRSHA